MVRMKAAFLGSCPLLGLLLTRWKRAVEGAPPLKLEAQLVFLVLFWSALLAVGTLYGWIPVESPAQSAAFLYNRIDAPAQSEDVDCCVCLAEAAVATLQPCGHRCLCLECVCALKMHGCPLCRGPILAVLYFRRHAHCLGALQGVVPAHSSSALATSSPSGASSSAGASCWLWLRRRATLRSRLARWRSARSRRFSGSRLCSRASSRLRSLLRSLRSLRARFDAILGAIFPLSAQLRARD